MNAQAARFEFDWNFYDDYALGVVRNHDVCRDLLNSKALKRLEDISFLGGIDFFSRDFEVTPISFTRYVHSIGVAYLASKLVRRRKLCDRAAKIAVAAALLHDVGHGALSHSIEPYFSERYGINHKHMTRRLIEGDFFVGSEISDILHDHGINPLDVSETIAGRGVDSQLFSGPINVDTLDGIIRAAATFEVRESSFKPDWFFAVLDDSASATERGDVFWQTKHCVYNKYIFAPAWAVYDAAVNDVLEKASARVDVGDYLMTDRQFGTKFAKEIYSARDRLRWDRLGAEYLYMKNSKLRRKRAFVIDQCVVVEKFADLPRRYKEVHTTYEDA